ncbi:MAG: hypothetical protein E7478_02520 [Ruminococcaceae bacterium]|nr:hypothetical protein [Oscillospiraceae bacterium]
MNQDTTFVYRYSAKDNKEVQEIRRKYLPHEESKLEELKRLDSIVQNSGMIESLCIGVGGVLVFGLGLCLAMQVIGSGMFAVVSGVLLGIIGTAGMVVAYPIYRKVFSKTKEQYAPRILELTAELTNENNSAL